MVVYVDVLLVTNFLISYFLLLAASVMSGYTYNRKRIIISAAAGAVFCLYIFMDGLNFIADFFIKLVSLVICSVIAFGIKDKRKTAIQSVCFALLNMLLTGAVAAVSHKSSVVYHNNMFFYFGINPVMLVTASAVIYLLILFFELVKEKISPQKLYSIDIVFKDFKIKDVSAFYDSGFKVKDIIANKDVVALSFEKVKSMVPAEIKDSIICFFSSDYTSAGCQFTPVFFNTLAGGGMMPALKAEYISYGEKRVHNILVAFTENELSENVSAIFGTDIKNQL